MQYTFYVEVNEGEVATVEANSLKEAKKLFSEMHPEDINKIGTITSENGYEEIS